MSLSSWLTQRLAYKVAIWKLCTSHPKEVLEKVDLRTMSNVKKIIEQKSQLNRVGEAPISCEDSRVQ